MPTPLPNDKLKWTRQYQSPAKDFVLREEVTEEKSKTLTIGQAHDNTGQYGGFKLCAFQPVEGGQAAYYLKTREEQWRYNYEHSSAVGDDLPAISYKWIVLRSEYAANGSVPAIPANQMPTFGGAYTWTLVGERMRRMDDIYDGLFVEVTHDYWDKDHPIRAEELDGDTGEVRTVLRTLVPANTTGHGVNEAGEVATYQPINEHAGWLVTRKAGGLAGGMVNGRKVRVTRGVKPQYWPKVLDYIAVYPILTDSRDAFSPVADYGVARKFRAEDYNDVCKATFIEVVTTKEPQFGPVNVDPNWSTALYDEPAADLDAQADVLEAQANAETNPATEATLRAQVSALRAQADALRAVSPEIPVPVPLMEKGVQFQGKELRVFCEPCLRQEYTFQDSGFRETFPASSPIRWPESRLVDATVTHEGGVWFTRYTIVDAPNILGLSSGLDLNFRSAPGTTSVEVAWTPAIGTSTPQLTKLDVATDPTFRRGFLSGYNNRTVTPATNTPVDTWTTITGMQRGAIYYVRVRVGIQISNTLVVTSDAQPELEVLRAGLALTSPAVVAFGEVATGETGRVSIDLASVGLLTLQELTGELDEAGVFTFDEPPQIIAAGGVASIELRFTPDLAGDHEATLTIGSDDLDAPFTLTLQGIGIAAKLRIDQPAGTEVVTGGTVAFGTVSSTPAPLTFRLSNVGNVPLREIALSLSGDDAADWRITTALTDTEISAGAYRDIVLTFDPQDSGAAAARAAVLTVTSTDADYTVNLTGVFQLPEAPGTLDLGYDPNANGLIRGAGVQADGKTVIAGDFTTVAGSTRNRIARLNADGTLDAGFDPNANGVVRCVMILKDGKILIGGEFTTVAGTARNRIARLNADGTLDSWYPTGGVDGTVLCMAMKDNGAVWIGGPFSTVGGSTRKRIALLNADGTVNATDPSVALGISIPAVGDVRGMVLLPDERLVICGYYFAVFGWGFCARLLADGTVDGSFVGQVYFNGPVNAVAVLPDERVLCGGSFTTMSSVVGTFPSIAPGAPVYNRSNVMLLDSAGVPVSTALDANGAVLCALLQTDGAVWLGGDFTTLAGAALNRIARLNPAMLLDAAVNPNANGAVHGLALQADGKAVAVGAFTSMGGSTRNRAARLYNDAVIDSTLIVESASTVRWLRGGALPEAYRVAFELNSGSGYGALTGTLARLPGGWQLSGLALALDGTVRALALPSTGASGSVLKTERTYTLDPEITVSLGAAAIESGDSYDFGEVQAGAAETVTLAIRNTGLADLTITLPVAITGTAAASYSVITPPAATVPAGSDTLLVLRFLPATTGGKPAILTLTTNDADEGTWTLNLTGDGIPGPGSRDTDWNVAVNKAVSTITALPDGGLLIGGKLTTLNGVGRKLWGRVNAAVQGLPVSGQVDGGGVSGFVARADGGCLVSTYTQSGMSFTTRISLYNAAGARVTSYDVSVAGIVTMVPMPDGRTLINGSFSAVKSVTRRRSAMLTSAGGVDAAWVPAYDGTLHGNAVVLGDGSVIISTNGDVVKLRADGSLDSTFTGFIGDSRSLLFPCVDGFCWSGAGSVFRHNATTGAQISAVAGIGELKAVLADGRYIVQRGDNTLARVFPDGSIDTSFAGPTSWQAVVAQTESGLLYFSTGNADVSKLIHESGGSVLSAADANTVLWMRSGTVPEVSWVRFELSQDDGLSWQLLGVGSRISGGWRLAGVNLPAAGKLRGLCGLAHGGLGRREVSYAGIAAPDIRVELDGIPLAGSVNFEGRIPNALSSSRQITLRNTGLATLSALAVSLTNTQWTSDGLEVVTLEPGQSTRLTLRCIPSAVGIRTGELVVTSNVPGLRSTVRVPLIGYGITDPVAATNAASGITALAATLTAKITPNADTAESYIRYRATSETLWQVTTPSWTDAGYAVITHAEPVVLLSGVTYEFQAVVTNAKSTRTSTLRTFTTP